MNRLKENLQYMEKQMPELYQQYLAAKQQDYKKNQIEAYETNGYLNTTLNGKHIHSRYNPLVEGRLFTMILEKETFDTVFIMGLGLGYHIDEIIEQYPDKNKIIYEPNLQVFEAFLTHFDIKKIHQQNLLLLLKDKKENIAKRMIDTFRAHKIYQVTFIGLPTYIAEYNEDWQYIAAEFVTFFRRYTIDIRTARRYQDLWLFNCFRNLKHYPFESEIDEYIGKFKGIPGVIVSSGPSLTKNMHLLNEIKDKAVIVAAGSSINALQDNGISPHIMLGADGSQLMSDEYNAVKDHSMIFSHIMNIHPECIDQYKGPKMHFRVVSESHMLYFEKVNNIKTTVVSMGGSCANLAMDFLHKLGCTPIILIGQDLAFTGNVTHAEGVWDRMNVKEHTGNLIVIKDIHGNDVYTDPIFNSFRVWFEVYIKEVAAAGRPVYVINATEGGAFIKGAEHMTFREAIDKHCRQSLNIRGMLHELHEKSLGKIEENKQHIRHFIDVVEADISEIESLSKKRMELLLKLREKLDKNDTNINRLRDTINKTTDELEAGEAYTYLIKIALREIIAGIKNSCEQQAQAETNITKKLKILYEGLQKQFDEVHTRVLVIKSALEELKENIKEWNDSHDE